MNPSSERWLDTTMYGPMGEITTAITAWFGIVVIGVDKILSL